MLEAFDKDDRYCATGDEKYYLDLPGKENEKVLALNTIRQVFFLFEQTRASHFHGGVSAVQTSPNELAVNFYNAERPLKIDSPVPVENVFLTEGGVFIYGAGTYTHENYTTPFLQNKT